jgi:hypothetical protein
MVFVVREAGGTGWPRRHRTTILNTAHLHTAMRRSHIRSHKPAGIPLHQKTISAALPHTLADNRRLFTLQLFHQPQHLMPVQACDLPDLCIRQPLRNTLKARFSAAFWSGDVITVFE